MKLMIYTKINFNKQIFYFSHIVVVFSHRDRYKLYNLTLVILCIVQ